MSSLCREKHDIEDGKYYLQQTLKERSKLIFKKKLYYGCFQDIKKDHTAKNSGQRSFYQYLGRKLTLLNTSVTVSQVRREKMVK